MNAKPEYCPMCNSYTMDFGGSLWSLIHARVRMNQYRCNECGWCSEPFEPEYRDIPSVIQVFPSFPRSGWHIETYDKYGQCGTSIEGIKDRDSAVKMLNEELDKINGRKTPGYPWTGILYHVPSTYEVKCEIFKQHS